MKSKLTPLMHQYRKIKDQYMDSILFFQVGDFYETFYDDAKEVSKLLNITLTTRDRDKKNAVPLAGVPIHAAESYIAKLLQMGKKVVVCDQVEDPSQAKGIVERAVTDVITPGTTLTPSTLNDNENNFILSMNKEDDLVGFAILDISTGEFITGEEQFSIIENLLSGYRIKEVLIPEEDEDLEELVNHINSGPIIEKLDRNIFDPLNAKSVLLDHFHIKNLNRFELEERPLTFSTAGALLTYVKELRKNPLKHISSLRYIAGTEYLYMDSETMRNLEIFNPIREDSTESALINHIDRTKTAGGARELRQWLAHPLRDRRRINERLDGVDSFISNRKSISRLRNLLNRMPDIERIVSRISTGKGGPRELLALADTLERLPEIIESLKNINAQIVAQAVERLQVKLDSLELIRRSIDMNCPLSIKDGGVIKEGYDEELDKLILESRSGKKWIASLQEKERQQTGIPSLKVGYNKVFGYFIEVSKANEDKVPRHYICKQTLVSAQRYITAELKEKENAILSADSHRTELEKKLFADICQRIASESPKLQAVAKSIANLDVISSLADIAIERNYCRPEIDESDSIVISEGRHPVVELISDRGFIPNDLEMRPEDKQVLIITGPNMGGKSTYIRQVALITIMAQAGSFVPASRVSMGVVDRVFTRVGSSDNLAKGQSTFLAEMMETSKILNNCTSHSLVIMDEVGRGTSTLDGLSIAWAVTEFLLENERARSKTLFATHYHELTKLAEIYPRVLNLRVEVKEWGDSIIFLYKIRQGASDKSYGIHVAKLAGLPSNVIKRANEILESLEKERKSDKEFPLQKKAVQPFLFEDTDEIREKLEKVDINTITPLDALNLLSEIVKIAKNRH